MKGSFIREGNLGGNPELTFQDNPREPGNKIALCKFSARFDRSIPTDNPDNPYEDRGGFWMDVEVWGGRAETYAKLLKFGARVLVIGDQILDEWKDKETGEPRSKMKIKASQIFLALNNKVQAINFAPKASGNYQQTPPSPSSEGNDTF